MKDKRNAILVTVGVFILIVLVVGSTYAYFQTNMNNNLSNTTIKGEIEKVGNATLTKVTTNLHMTMGMDEFNVDNIGKSYYGVTDDDNKNFESSLDAGTKILARLSLDKGEDDTKNICHAKLNVELDNTSLNNMGSVLEEGDAKLYVGGGNLEDLIDLSEFKTTNHKEYDLLFNMVGNETRDIKTYLIFNNLDKNQIYLMNKTLNVNLSITDLSCDIVKDFGETSLETKLRNDDKNNTLSLEKQGGLYRYQGANTSVLNNYICFGTDNLETCKSDEDKYMYRIMGITSDGKLELIKKTALNDEGVQWNSTYRSEWNNSTDVNEKTKDADIPWSKSDLFNKLNGKSDNNLFIGNTDYEYLNTGSTWYNKISDTEWISGKFGWDNTYFQIPMIYHVESGQSIANYYEEESPYYYNGGTDTVSKDDIYISRKQQDGVKCERYDSINKVTCYKTITGKTFDDKVTAKIGLMHVYDYDYAVQKGGLNCFYDNVYDRSNGTDTPKQELTTCQNSWIHISNNDTTVKEKGVHDWTLSRDGFRPAHDTFGAWSVFSMGYVSHNWVNYSLSARPVFFLNSNISIKSGNGSESTPYVLNA